jgi:hypothetical protein
MIQIDRARKAQTGFSESRKCQKSGDCEPLGYGLICHEFRWFIIKAFRKAVKRIWMFSLLKTLGTIVALTESQERSEEFSSFAFLLFEANR